MACGDLINEIEDALSSSFDASVTGDVSSSFSGNATFVSSVVESQSPQSSSIVIELENVDNPDEVVQLSIVLSNTTAGVTTGTYAYDVNSTSVLVSGSYNNTDNSFIIPDPTATNQVILSKVEGSRVEGTFNLTLVNVLGDKVTVTGSFSALGFTQTI